MTSTFVWFLLVDSATGQPYKGTSVDAVSLPPDSFVVQFRKLVHLENSNKLTGVDASDLIVFKNKAALDKRNNAEGEGKELPLDPTESIGVLGSKEDMLVVVVPSPRRSSQISTDVFLMKEPNPNRKDRWDKLNEILSKNKKKSTKHKNDSTAYSYVSWNDVESVFAPVKYVQEQRPVDDIHLNFLAQYLSYTTKCFGPIHTGKEAKRVHFIAPILVCVCFLFEGDVMIVAEEDLVGKYVRAHGHFEFMLKRGRKAICIVEAKKDNLEQGMAQDLVGCEVAAEVGELDVVYGIVTNYVSWVFFCSRNDEVKYEDFSLGLLSNGPVRESLKELVEKIYLMLSDD
ncbi:hypothetical protein ACHAWX_004263 [Stephanocyclus meneghinianus]